MVNDTLKKNGSKQKLKACYGTSEWSATSGICGGCKLKNSCGKIRLKRLGN